MGEVDSTTPAVVAPIAFRKFLLDIMVINYLMITIFNPFVGTLHLLVAL